MGKRFTRQKEDFVCENCGKEVVGGGYTNHCPDCLYSKHVDINPGDRQHSCRGLMMPVRIEIKGGKYIIVHQCLECGVIKKNKASPNDSFDTILAVVRSGHKEG
ncbi:MAG: RNHCP domain-containing protein [Patescibacteria group bacterium]